ncbi:MAG: efflux RND transporter periplasmic adaptor subunit, partial [Bacteroidales bacterium]|nr:efflux RND transporter periplasmic adaptor subunit [Bacteroidales bacterium]
MKNYILFYIAVIGTVLASCSSDDLASKKEAMQTNLYEKEKAYAELKQEINALQIQINELDTAKVYKSVTVEVQEVETTNFQSFFHVNGSLEAVASAYVSPEISGQIKHIYVKEGGQVSKGQKLIKLNTTIIENSIREVETALSLASVVYKKQKELWDRRIGSEIDYLKAKNDVESLQNKLKTLKSQEDMAIIKAPISGVIEEVVPKVGELAMPGQIMVQILDLDTFYFNAEVSESYLPFLKKGDPVEVSLLAYDETINTEIYRIANTINLESRSFLVQMKLKNNKGILKPNMLAEAKFKDFEDDKAFVFPSNVIKKDYSGSYLYVAVLKEGKYIAKKRYVKTGRNQAK